VAATGTALTYQWQINTGSGFVNLPNGGAYSGTTTNTLLITGGLFAMHNYQYRCIVAGACTPSVTSGYGVLKINTLPAVTLQPHDSTICDGGSASYNITATGTGITYQWQVNTGSGYTNILNNTIYSGATTNILQLTGASATMHNYQYRCVVSGTCTPSAASMPALLKVNTLPNITLQPHDSTLCEGLDASFAITATGTALTYQWQVDNGTGFADVLNNSKYNGATNAQLDIASVPYTMHNYAYRCIVSGTCTPPDTSNIVYLKVNTSPVVTVNPAPNTICEGSNTSFVITATGTALIYQWQVNDGNGYANVVNNAMYTGATNNQLDITAAVANMNTYQYRCIVNGTCTPADTSGDALLTIYTSPVITKDPANSAICPRESTTFNVAATGTNVAYQWQEDNGNGFSNLVNNTNYSGVYSTTLGVMNVTGSMNAYRYRCVVSGSCQPMVVSDTATLTVHPEAIATLQSNKNTICAGDSIVLRGGPATGVTYQWKKDNVNIAGANAANFIARETGKYKLTVFNDFCYSTSDSLTVTVNPLPVTGVYIDDIKVICPDSFVEMKVVKGLNTSYQWRLNYQNIPGATGENYIATTPGIYNVISTNNFFCTRESDTLEVKSDPGPSPKITVEQSILCTGNFATYQWFVDSISVLRATTACYAAKQNGSYTVLVTNYNGCPAYSAPYQMNDVGKEYVLVSPNPAVNEIHINTSLVVDVTLSTMEGKILLRQEKTKLVDISSLPNGPYMLRVFSQDGDMVRAERIIKVSK
jgi:hypothetical protein